MPSLGYDFPMRYTHRPDSVCLIECAYLTGCAYLVQYAYFIQLTYLTRYACSTDMLIWLDTLI